MNPRQPGATGAAANRAASRTTRPSAPPRRSADVTASRLLRVADRAQPLVRLDLAGAAQIPFDAGGAFGAPFGLLRDPGRELAGRRIDPLVTAVVALGVGPLDDLLAALVDL